MNKINFQNGTLLSKAKVTINGTVYEVEPEEYEGETPLSAEILNEMQDNIEDAINEVAENLDNTNTYSTTEINTGKKWIDGKPIYRKSFIVGSLPNDTTIFIPHNINNFERPVNIEASWYDIEDNRWYYITRSGDVARVVFTANSTNLIIQAVGTDWSHRTNNCVVTIEYIKTTD